MHNTRKKLGSKRSRTVVNFLRSETEESHVFTNNESENEISGSESDDLEYFSISSDCDINENFNPFVKVNEKVTKKVLNLSLKKFLAHWITMFNINRTASNILLTYLNANVDKRIPKDYRTLLNTPKESNTIKLGNGEYLHLGIEEAIKRSEFDFSSFENDHEFYVDFNVDGASVS